MRYSGAIKTIEVTVSVLVPKYFQNMLSQKNRFPRVCIMFHIEITPEYMDILCIYSHKKVIGENFSKLQP